jgi:hypothetical protein
MRVYGVADHTLREAIELFPSREEAKAFLAQVLVDEPEWEEDRVRASGCQCRRRLDEGGR